MSNPSTAFPCPFTAAERTLIRADFRTRSGQLPRLSAGLFLRRWRSGLAAGQPRLPVAVQSLVRRELMALRAFFTEAGFEAGGPGRLS